MACSFALLLISVFWLAGRTVKSKLDASGRAESTVVEALCDRHAEIQAINYWFDFLEQVDTAGMGHCVELRMKVTALLQLAFKAIYRVDYVDSQWCSTPQCGHRSSAGSTLCSRCQQLAVDGPQCRTDGCRNDPVTDGGLCLQCCITRSSQFAVTSEKHKRWSGEWQTTADLLNIYLL